jgi:hypothetical protein
MPDPITQASDATQMLGLLGLTLPSPAYIFGAIVFGIIGIVAYRYGKKAELPLTRWLGLALMLYPYLVTQTWLLYLVGAALCAGMLFDRFRT